jgi:RNA recognition motif-containing protein
MIILIRNLDRSTDRIQLHALLRKFGKVKSLDLIMDPETGHSKGFAFAEYGTAKEAMIAIHNMNGMELGSNILRVKKAANSSVQKGKARQPQAERSGDYAPRPRKKPRPRGRR